jgi:hypothetical protein
MELVGMGRCGPGGQETSVSCPQVQVYFAQQVDPQQLPSQQVPSQGPPEQQLPSQQAQQETILLEGTGPVAWAKGRAARANVRASSVFMVGLG